MTETPENRRPLKSRGTGWAQGLASGLAKAGADFLAVSAGVWAHPQGPAAAVAALNAAIARGVAARQA